MNDTFLGLLFRIYSEEVNAAQWDSGLLDGDGFSEWLKRQMVRPIERYEAIDMPKVREQWQKAQHRR